MKTSVEEAQRTPAWSAVWVQTGAVLAVWMLGLLAENLFVAIAHRGELAGAWEAREVRRWVTPIALAALTPLALGTTILARLAMRSRTGTTASLASCAGAVAVGISNGRHFASLAVRIPFVVLLAGFAAGGAWLTWPSLVRAATTRPRRLALLGVATGIGAWCTDAFVLPRLYPAFHLALFVATITLTALAALALRPAPGDRTRAPSIVAAIALSCAALSLVRAPANARLLAGADNVRIVVAEHAPVLGRAVELASLAFPPPPLDDAPDSTAAPFELPRALDWSGRDIVLITVDALRADHVGAYGYARSTTPNLDALAGGGVRFDAAYCPTPHTSYSIASLMTGKYMRPLIALGLGADSDTWAGMLRRYGYRTAAFYPPAVFFIDAEHFEAMHARGLDFEYRKEEFASPELRATQVAEYVAKAPRDKPLFLWVHFFEPHEPYVQHPSHVFGDGDVDRYDSEIAAADEGIGAIVREVRASRPGAIVIATADHGEEFGDHGGRYHGTTVFEEQVRVPLIVEGPGVPHGSIASVAQTIDLLPTVLSALGIPRPARLRGRDLGPALAGKGDGARDEQGLAFAETDEYTLLARGRERLICERRVSGCALYDLGVDPLERHDASAEHPSDLRDLRRLSATVAGEHGRFERGEEAAWPEALRRGIAGDADAATEVAGLLDDASAAVRAKAAEVSFDLHAPDVAPAMRRATGDPRADEPVKRWCALALVRLGESPSPLAEALVHDPDVAWRRVAALAFAERGDARGAGELATWWGERGGVDFVRATEILSALGKIRDRTAVPALVRSLDDVRLRPYVADALGIIGDPSAREPLASSLGSEAQVTSITHEARALVALGGAAWVAGSNPGPSLDVRIALPRGRSRLRLVLLQTAAAPRSATINEVTAASSEATLSHAFDVDAPTHGPLHVVSEGAGLTAVLLVRVPETLDGGGP